MINQNRLLITHSLLDSWNYVYKATDEWRDSAYSNFLQTLNRVGVTPTQAMLNGREFERLVSDVVNNKEADYSHKWIDGATEIADIVREDCSLEQVKLYKDITVNNVNYLLYGILDWLGCGAIYDVKFKENISNYGVGSYFDNTQHRMYFALADGAVRFEYLISNGKKVYRESYRRYECRPIEQTISDFERCLRCCNLWGVYTDKWIA